MLHASFFCDVSHESALFLLSDIIDCLNRMRKIVCEAIEAVGARQSVQKALSIVEVACYEGDVRAEIGELLCSWFIGIASQCTKLLSE